MHEQDDGVCAHLPSHPTDRSACIWGRRHAEHGLELPYLTLPCVTFFYGVHAAMWDGCVRWWHNTHGMTHGASTPTNATGLPCLSCCDSANVMVLVGRLENVALPSHESRWPRAISAAGHLSRPLSPGRHCAGDGGWVGACGEGLRSVLHAMRAAVAPWPCSMLIGLWGCGPRCWEHHRKRAFHLLACRRSHTLSHLILPACFCHPPAH